MPRGVALPTRAVNGRLQLLDGTEYVKQLVLTALGDDESDNPFQSIGLGESFLFKLNNANTDGEIRARVEAIFRSLQQDELARLLAVRFEKRDGSERACVVSFEDMESGQREEFELPSVTNPIP